MSEPVAQGELWHALSTNFAGRLVCLVAARDLRRETLGLSHGLSWEATLDDLRVALNAHPAALHLLRCHHLIVTFSSDGALWLDRAAAQGSGRVSASIPRGPKGNGPRSLKKKRWASTAR